MFQIIFDFKSTLPPHPLPTTTTLYPPPAPNRSHPKFHQAKLTDHTILYRSSMKLS